MVAVPVGLCLLGALVGCEEDAGGSKTRPAAAVAVAPITRGRIILRRTYSGTLEAPARFVVASKVSGRVERLNVDLGDEVERGQIVAIIEDDELRQVAAQATAALAVARANLKKANSGLVIARRTLKRTTTLRKRGVSSEAQLDEAKAAVLERKADLEVARADVVRGEAAEGAARIRLQYTRITAEWSGGDNHRVVADRQVSAGALVAENTPIFTIVELDPITGVLFVPEKDYRRVRVGQQGELVTDAFGGETFSARVARIAPVFDPSSRQARVELSADNADRRLKPGMFVRVTLILDAVDNATIVPLSAVTTREDRTGVFVINPDGRTVSWRLVRLGIKEEGRVQILGEHENMTGSVVVLGQQLISEGSVVTIPTSTSAAR